MPIRDIILEDSKENDKPNEPKYQISIPDTQIGPCIPRQLQFDGSKSFEFNIGDIVYKRAYVLSDKDKHFSKKLAPKYNKCRVIQKLSPLVYVLEDMSVYLLCGNPELGCWQRAANAIRPPVEAVVPEAPEENEQNVHLYIPDGARVCREHLEGNNWDELPDFCNTTHDFNAAQFKDVCDMLRTTIQRGSRLDFSLQGAMTDEEMHYWFDDILEETPSLGMRCNDPRTALAILLVKLRTGDSDERLATLFNMSRRKLERYLAIAHRRETQLTTEQANEARAVTMYRWVVERQKYFNRALPHMFGDFKIAAAIINHFHVLIQDNVHAEFLKSYKTQKNRLDDLPDYGIQENVWLLRGRIQSRHVRQRTYYCYILINNNSNEDNDIVQHYCTCISGRRTMGTCAYTISIIWYLGYAIHEGFTAPAMFLNDVIIDYP
ncbi:hypothetical protein HW555_006457 [Spodoptera exigua]|uniref:SWIM-type domain-containing protein n=1 Tax=Spodoptera exigua TaxID=7107 RepID=A0A835GGX1_SPOEX|nr:hypothetical protein HW555_006457 [Spodoptera exigua]